jgi:hypothetical protein
MSREEGPERTQRTVAELLAKYGDSSQESAPRRRRRRAEDAEETAPQAIIDRIKSDSGTFAPVRDESQPEQQQQPPPQPAPPAGHAAPTSRHRPVPQPAPQQPPQPSQQLPQPSAPPPPQALQPTQRQMPPVAPPERRERRPEPRPQPSQQLPQPSQQLPKPPPRPQPQQTSGGWPAPPPEQGGGSSGRLDGRQESRSDLRPVPPSSPMQEGMTEQIPRVTDEPPAANMRTGQHPAPHRVARTARGPQPSMPLPQPPPAFPQNEPIEDDNYPTEYHGFEPVQDEIPERTQFVEGIERDDDEYGHGRSVEHDRPIGVDDEDYDDDEDGDEDRPPSSPVKEWLSMAGQLAIGVVGGAALWLGFNWLWGKLPVAALVVALVVTVGMVWVVRKIRHQEDLWTTIITMVVSLVITMSPVLLSH